MPLPAALPLLLLLFPPPPATACVDCHGGDAEVLAFVEELKQRVLAGLQMLDAQPNITRRLMPPSVMKLQSKLLWSQSEPLRRPPAPPHAHTVKLWTLASRSPLAADTGPLAGTRLGADAMVFQLPPEVSLRSLSSAQLLLRRRATQRLSGPGYVNIYKLAPRGSNYQLAEATTRTVRPLSVHGGLVAVDVTSLVRHWLKHPDHNLGLVVRATDRSGRTDAGQYVTTEQGDRWTPVLQTKLRRHAQRSRRAADASRQCGDPRADPRCCLYPLTVDFHSFGWDWIIAPSSYVANFCRGQCPAVFLQKYPHSHIVQQVGGRSGPCCSPRRFEPLKMLYWNRAQHIQYAKLPDMRVVSCGCQ